MEEKCKTCKAWKNKQRELDYVKEYGICVGTNEYWDDSVLIKIRPHEELFLMIQNKCCNDDSTIKAYEYEFCTHEYFGCNKWTK